MKKKLIFSLTAVIIIGMILILTAPKIERLEIEQQSLSLAVGESVQLNCLGYFADGEPAGAQELNKLNLLWESRSEDLAIEVDENGLLTAIKPGMGNVQVKSADGKLNSRAITIKVYE